MKRTTPQFRAGHRVQLLQGAAELFPALAQAMDGARHTVLFETYIFDTTGAGAEVAEALMRAAQRGVRTQLVVDGVGTGRLPAPWYERLRTAGVHVRVYSPLGPLGLLLPMRWRRLHRKLCVVDGQVLFCGGINVLDDYHDPNFGTLQAPRFDFAVRAEGALVAQAQATMEQLWWRIQAVRDVRQYHLPEAVHALREAGVGSPPRQRGLGMRAALLLRDNLRNRSRIEQAYRRAIASAQHEIIIANAYFLPVASCAVRWCWRRGAVYACSCCCKGAMNTSCSTTLRALCTARCCAQGSRSTSTSPASCTPRWP